MNVLLLDDEKLALAALKREVETVFPEAEINCCHSAEEAIACAERLKENSENLDYAFCDINIPQISGLEIARMLKSSFPELKLFFCTAYSQYAIDAFGLKAKGYLLKPVRAQDIIEVLDEMVSDWQSEPAALKKDIRVRTFGDFEVFVDGKPVRFGRAKSKELFAYLVDRRGAGVSTERIAAILFAEENYSTALKNSVTRIVSFLRADLKAAGIEDVLVKSWNQLAINPDKIKCDAYDFMNGDMLAVNAYFGEYMYGYEWAEFSVGTFDRIKESRLRENKGKFNKD
ncbi:MAG: response regulator [Candidatus Coproplasma sp.]